MSLQGALTGAFPLSPVALNARVNFVGTGAEINALSPTYSGMEAHCTADYLSIFKKNHVYIRDAENQKWISITGFKHLHDADTEEAGGLLSDIMVANGFQSYMLSLPCPTWGNILTEAAGLTEINDYDVGVAINLSNTLGDYANLIIRGTALACNKDFVWLARLSIDSGSYMSVKCGVGMERIEMADDILNKCGIEACDTSGTARTWAFTSANGSGRDMIGTSSPVSVQDTFFGHACYVDSGNVCRFVYEGAHVTPALTKTTNVPSAGSTLNTNVCHIGYKNNNASEKSLFLGGLFIYGQIGVPL